MIAAPEELTGERLARMTAAEFDALPFGAIRLDADGRVVGFNVAEARLARRRPEATLGRLFFEDIAPCTNTEAFRGRLDSLARAGEGTETFDYVFEFPWGIRQVRIRLMVLPDHSRWVFVSTLRIEERPAAEDGRGRLEGSST